MTAANCIHVHTQIEQLNDDCCGQLINKCECEFIASLFCVHKRDFSISSERENQRKVKRVIECAQIVFFLLFALFSRIVILCFFGFIWCIRSLLWLMLRDTLSADAIAAHTLLNVSYWNFIYVF